MILHVFSNLNDFLILCKIQPQVPPAGPVFLPIIPARVSHFVCPTLSPAPGAALPVHPFQAGTGRNGQLLPGLREE